MNDVLTILLAAGVASGLTTVLAAMLLLAQRYLVNYGTRRISINEGRRTLEVAGGGSLLDTLTTQEVFIPSACGGRGTCAYCKVRIISGGGPVGPTEQALLTEQEVADDVRISCQCKVREDMDIRIPDELFSVRQYRGVVEQITDLTHDIKQLRIRLLAPDSITFTAGQYVQLEAPAYAKNPEPIWRAYSIASPPEQTGEIELIIRLAPGGICTTWVFEHLAEGNEVSFSGPYGDFGLSDVDTPMIWIAGGSGMAPFWSMVRHLKAIGASRPCTYFFGAVNRRDLFLVDELQQLDRELEWFHFAPALSGRESVDNANWVGLRGLITDVVRQGAGDMSSTEAYLCGSPGMIDASVAVLEEMGINEKSIRYDKFM